MTRTKQSNTNRVLAKLGEVDWLRLMQRASVFLRDFRGDDPRDIQDDHVTELERSQKLRAAAEGVSNPRARRSSNR
ncbi:MAG TPA: hypothetical protein VFN67_37475 [Polyangiales bacterium]|nr:hypothetical protein [Polyangiales bacterium]